MVGTRGSFWRLIGDGAGIHWLDLDEDISVEHILAGKPSGESQHSLRQWLATRSSSEHNTDVAGTDLLRCARNDKDGADPKQAARAEPSVRELRHSGVLAFPHSVVSSCGIILLITFEA